MRRLQLGDLELFSFKVFEASLEARLKFAAKLTEEFSGTSVMDFLPFKNRYAELSVSPTDPDDVRFPVFGNIFLLRRAGLTLLVDTGVGYPRPDAPYSFVFPNELEQAGIARESVDIVFLTHNHPDHIGWVCTDGKPNFPEANHYFPEADLEPLRSQYPELFEEQIRPLMDAGRLEPLEGEQHIAEGISTFSVPGHTAGQLGLWIEHPEQPVLVAADALHYPMQVNRPEWLGTYDWNAEMAVESRKRVVAKATQSDALLCVTHYSTPGIGKVLRSGQETYWEAI